MSTGTESIKDTALNCQSCHSVRLEKVLDLGQQPLCNEFVSAELAIGPQIYYPLCLYYCNDCRLVQLNYIMPTDLAFGDQYTYLTGSSPSLIKYYSELAKSLVDRFGLQVGDAVVDIGSNDGTFLKEFKALGMEVVGVEGAKQSATLALESGINVVQEFFRQGSASKVKEALPSNSNIKLILTMNVLAHTDNIGSFMIELKKLMDEETILVCSCHWLVELIRKSEFDTIYHEHLRYYTLGSLMSVFGQADLFFFDAEVTDFYGGSILGYATLNKKVPSDGMTNILGIEDKTNILVSLRQMKTTLIQNKSRLIGLLTELKLSGNRIVGVGAPMKASTLLNFYGVTSDLIDYIAEVNELKVGTVVPGVRIPVISEEIIFQDQPDYAILLSWNMAAPIISNYRAMGYRGKFIMPVPEPEVIDD